ncbi:MAG: hypothetical protein DHS20C18_14350 [Saprospiraceae bacterium]|nr:MAG: hypothetical protein DHS20C18_14350 [Saprospiraceae bacterium]
MDNLIFISYRRGDGNNVARALKIDLEQHLGSETVFLDSNINPGDKWPETIEKALRDARIVLAVIGPEWLTKREQGSGRRKIDSEEDWVRREIEETIAAGDKKTLIPVLLENVKQPEKEWLPDSIKSIFNNQIYHFRWDYRENDCKKLLDHIKILIGWKGLNKVQTVSNDKLSLLNKVLPFSSKDFPVPVIPFVGPIPFEKKEAKVFFGRSENILTLNDKINNPERRLILFYGSSGVGKSSLLFAGLFPRLIDKWNVHYHRRKLLQTLPKDLEEILSKSKESDLPTLLLLDQVEEMYTNPDKVLEDKEPDLLVEKIIHALNEYPNVRILLSFRKEYLSEIQNLFSNKNIPFLRMPLSPLDRSGIIEAITWIVHNKTLNDVYFNLEIEPGLPEQIAEDILRGQRSHVAPMLQIQLRKMWDLVNGQEKPRFTLSLYNEVKDSSLEEFLNGQIKVIQQLFPEEVESGLVLDILHFFTTGRATAGEHLQSDLIALYPPLQAETITRLCQELVNKYLLTFNTEFQPQTLRLAHDALAPPIRQLFNNSDAAGPRAARILQSKKKDIMAGRDVEFSLIDLEIIEKGEDGMKKLGSIEEKILELNKKRVQEREIQFINNIQQTVDAVIDQLYHLEYENAHVKLVHAAEKVFELEQEGTRLKFLLATGLKEQINKIASGFIEFAYFYNECGEVDFAIDLTKKAIKLLNRTDIAEELETQSHHLPLPRNYLRRILEQMDESQFANLENRYYPKMVPVQGGEFSMGNSEGEKSEQEVHKVKLKDFRMASTPITFWQFGLYCKAVGRNIEELKDSWGIHGDNPVINVNWYDCLHYANWLSNQKNLLPAYYSIKEGKNSFLIKNEMEDNDFLFDSIWKSNGFRLPTEAEWEYAARGGINKNKYTFAGSDTIMDVAWHDANSINRTHPTGSLKPNGLGLFDMNGNTWEWCWDWYEKNYYSNSEVISPKGPSTGTFRTLRGGAYSSLNIACRVYSRYATVPNDKDSTYGFRLVQGF